MKLNLPPPIFDRVKMAFAHHGCWHDLRSSTSSGARALRNKCFGKGELGKLWPDGLKAQEEAGSGKDFFLFHRLMIRNFKWIIKDAMPKYQYAPWTDFPCFVASALDAMDPCYRQELAKRLDYMTANGSLDDLGRFIEGPDSNYPYIHFVVHGIVHDYEDSHFGSQFESDMGVFQLAAFNEHFWRFHGWIDEIYARWQIAHGEDVNQTPLEPGSMSHMCRECDEDQTDRTSTWILWWREYLASQSRTR
jgi:hypothetical protein